MRKSEITDDLILLSKQAKELGFPQDVEVGSWVIYIINDQLYCIGSEINPDYMNRIKDEWFLILSFSRCLAWLVQKDYNVEFWFDLGAYETRIYNQEGDSVAHFWADFSHEAIAKVVRKVLEDDNG